MWHYNNNGTTLGPLHEGDLIGLMHSGVVTATTLVWQEGMAEWTPAAGTSLATFLPAAAAPMTAGPAPPIPPVNPYAPPAATLTPAAFYAHAKTTPLTWKQILFGFEGRIPRRQYWAASGIMMLVGLVFMVPIFILESASSSSGAGSGMSMLAVLILIPLAIAFFWMSLAITVKRWHDRGKSGWWMLLGLIPYIGSVWTFIECGCMRGTIGDNQYGSDPT